jgi:hypothetical protein
LAAGPILVTGDRQQVVDFTMPFMTLQATLLLRRPAANTELKVKSLFDLVGQSEIKYGTLRRGIIPRSFRQTNDSLLSTVWRNMRRSVNRYRRTLSDKNVADYSTVLSTENCCLLYFCLLIHACCVDR